MVSHTSHERSFFRITAIRPTTPAAIPHNNMKIQKKGNQDCLHHAFGAFSDAGTITVTLMTNIATNANTMPTARQPNLVLGRCHKEELE
jgi:hypothetical protein